MKEERTKRRFRWYWIPLGLIGLILLLIGGLIAFLHSMLPWQNLLAATSNMKVELSEKQKAYVTGGERDYSTLPEVLAAEDGTVITDTQQFEARREQILELFEDRKSVV